MPSWDEIYFGALGIISVLIGSLQLLAGVSGNSVSISVLSVSGTYLLWRGVIVVSAGAFFLYGSTHGLGSRRNQVVTVLAGTMLWIVAVTDLLGRFLGAIPGGHDVWVAELDQIALGFAPPYSPSIIFGLFALVVVKYRMQAFEPTAAGEGK
ncbi:MAG: hypothetical protein ACQEQJ_01100 [Halobacteriota archaeon]